MDEKQEQKILEDIQKEDESAKEIICQEKCPKCGNMELNVYSISTGIWEIWGKCTKCGKYFCMGTE